MSVKMWCPKGDCHLSLTSGHTFVVPGDRAGVEIEPRFRKEAIAKGCIPVGMEDDAPEESTTFDRGAKVRETMRMMLGSDDDSYFTSDGRPSITVLNKLLGFNVDRAERDREWKIVESDPDGVKADE